MIEWLNNKIGTRYWYAVRFIYKNKSGKVLDFVQEVGITKKATILKHRKIKKILLPIHKLNGIPKYVLCNGKIAVEVVAYLGWFKR